MVRGLLACTFLQPAHCKYLRILEYHQNHAILLIPLQRHMQLQVSLNVKICILSFQGGWQSVRQKDVVKVSNSLVLKSSRIAMTKMTPNFFLLAVALLGHIMLTLTGFVQICVAEIFFCDYACPVKIAIAWMLRNQQSLSLWNDRITVLLPCIQKIVFQCFSCNLFCKNEECYKK